MGKVTSVKSKKNSKLKKKKKLNIFDSKGFTLVELLATIAILSIVTTIVVFAAVNIIDNTKENTYELTINNVEKYASSYVLESGSSIEWIPGNTSNYQYQCVTVQNLMEAGYFDSDVLNSYVSEDQTVKTNDYVYLERDISTKTLTKNVLLVNNRLTNYSGLCSDIMAGGAISFSVEPDDWSLTKDITIEYDLYNNLDNVSNYKYSYIYNEDEATRNFNKLNMQESIRVDNNGVLNAMIMDQENRVLVSKTLVVDKIDNVDPEARIISAIDVATSNIATSNAATVQTVTLYFRDNASVVAYYFGKNNPNSQTVSWTELEGNGVRNKTLTSNVNSEGVWYLGVKDIVGNVTVVSKNFYKTILSVSNATVEPTYVITAENESFSVPYTKANDYYTFYGWYDNSEFSGDRINLYMAVKDSTLYGKVIENLLTAGSVSIVGDNMYGETLRAEIISDSIPKGSYSYQWYVSDTNSMTGGTLVSEEESIQLKAAHFDKYVYVVVTAEKNNYRSITFSDITDTSNNGSAKVRKRAITITANSNSKQYDGTALTDSGCQLSSGSFGYDTHSISECKMTKESTITNVGSIDNVIDTVTIYSSSAKGSVNEYYDITKVSGELTVTPQDTVPGSVKITGDNMYGEKLVASVSGAPSGSTYEYQWYVSDTNSKTGGTPVSNEASIQLKKDHFDKYVYVKVTIKNSNFKQKIVSDITDSSNNESAKVRPRPITIVANSNSKQYDGTALTDPNCKKTSGEFAYSHKLSSCTMSSESTITNVGSVANRIYTVVIVNDSDEIVTKFYNITKANGTLTVSYDNFEDGSVKITGTNTYGETLTANVTAPKPAAQKYVYRWYTNTSNSTTGGTLVAKHESSSLTDSIQLTATHFEKYIYVVVTAVKDNYTSKSFNDKTDSANNSSAKVAKRAITVTANSNNKTYNGSALTDSGCEKTSGEFVYSHRLSSCTMSSESYRTSAGSTANVIDTVIIKNTSGDNVTRYYDITKVDGTLTVNKASTAVVGSCKNDLVYSGKAQTLASGGSYVSYSNNSKTNAGDYKVTVTADENHKFDDGTTSKQLNCSIAKKTPTITLSATSGTVESSKNLTFTEKANTAGKFNNTSSDTDIATVSPASYSSVAKNTAKTVTITGVKSGSSTITVNFTPTDTTNFNSTSKTYTVKTTSTYKLVQTNGRWFIWTLPRYMWYDSNQDDNIDGVRVWDATGKSTNITNYVSIAKKYAMGAWSDNVSVYVCEDGGEICSTDQDIIYEKIDSSGNKKILGFVKIWVKRSEILTDAVYYECVSYYKTKKNTYGGPCEGNETKTINGKEYVSAWVSKYSKKDGGYSIEYKINEYFG